MKYLVFVICSHLNSTTPFFSSNLAEIRGPSFSTLGRQLPPLASPSWHHCIQFQFMGAWLCNKLPNKLKIKLLFENLELILITQRCLLITKKCESIIPSFPDKTSSWLNHTYILWEIGALELDKYEITLHFFLGEMSWAPWEFFLLVVGFYSLVSLCNYVHAALVVKICSYFWHLEFIVTTFFSLSHFNLSF